MDLAVESSDEITVVLADDHVIVRDGVRMVLESEDDIRVVADAGTAEDAARYVLGHRPSILILDLNMPGESSLDLIPKVLASSPETKVIVLTMQSELAFVRTALRAGASGYVVKHSAAGELVDAIRASLAGHTYLNPSLGAKLASAPDSEGPPDQLTPREIEVLGLLARGLTNPEIAHDLFLSVRTVETHRANIQRKTGTKTRAELISYVRKNDLEFPS
ncbi:MAG: response regulator [Solirubrobacterales bacterium]